MFVYNVPTTRKYKIFYAAVSIDITKHKSYNIIVKIINKRSTDMKKYIKFALVFVAVGLALGVFFREFSKAYGVVNVYTTLGLGHAHLLVLGAAFMLIFGLVTEKLGKQSSKLLKWAFPVYIAGVCGTGLMITVRGILDVLSQSKDTDFIVSSGANGAISGVSGIFHAVLGTGLILIFVAWLLKEKKQSAEQPEA